MPASSAFSCSFLTSCGIFRTVFGDDNWSTRIFLTQTFQDIILKMSLARPLFVYFGLFTTQFKYKLEKHTRCCAWDSNSGQQDDRGADGTLSYGRGPSIRNYYYCIIGLRNLFDKISLLLSFHLAQVFSLFNWANNFCLQNKMKKCFRQQSR